MSGISFFQNWADLGAASFFLNVRPQFSHYIAGAKYFFGSASLAKILSISSEVLSGAVGNTVARPVLSAMGHDVIALPTVILAAHPGHGPSDPMVTSPSNIDRLLSGLESLGRLKNLSAVLTGYFADAAQVYEVATWISRLKASHSSLTYICDPVLGDGKALYIREEVAKAIRDDLLPLANVATPNHFELAWLTGTKCQSKEEIVAAARALAPPTVVCTSALTHRGKLTSLLIESRDVEEVTTKLLKDVPHGTGDLLTALFAGRFVSHENHRDAFNAAVTKTFEICEKSEGQADLKVP